MIPAAAITFFGLFVLQNVFNQEVYRKAVPAAAERTIRHPEKTANPDERTAPEPKPAFGAARAEKKNGDPGRKQPDKK